MKKRSASPFRTAICMVSAIFVFLSAIVGCSSTDNHSESNKPTPNPYLSSPLYSITHFDSSQSDSTPYGPPGGTFTVDPTTKPIVYGGPINIITLASTNQDYMWAVGTDRVSYVNKAAGQWGTVTKFEALADASGNSLAAIPDANFRAFGESSAVGMTTATMDARLKTLFGDNYSSRFGNGTYVLVDKDNVVYTNYGDTLYGLALINPAQPSAGIKILYKMENICLLYTSPSPRD